MIRAVVGLAAVLAVSACTADHNARRMLRASGISDPLLTGPALTEECDKPSYNQSFTGYDGAGNRVTGTVCGNGRTGLAVWRSMKLGD